MPIKPARKVTRPKAKASPKPREGPKKAIVKRAPKPKPKKTPPPRPPKVAIPRRKDEAGVVRPIGPPDLSTLVIPPEASRKEISALYRVNESTICRWQQDGVDLFSPAQVQAKIDSLLVKPPAYRAAGIDPVTYDAARTRKMALQCVQLERAMDREEADWTHNEVIRSSALDAVAVLRAGMLKLEAELPPLLVGLDEPAMQKEIRPRIDEMLDDFSRKLGDLAGSDLS